MSGPGVDPSGFGEITDPLDLWQRTSVRKQEACFLQGGQSRGNWDVPDDGAHAGSLYRHSWPAIWMATTATKPSAFGSLFFDAERRLLRLECVHNYSVSVLEL
jgi:hypothetical protein